MGIMGIELCTHLNYKIQVQFQFKEYMGYTANNNIYTNMYVQSHGPVCVHMYMHCGCIHAPCKIQGILSRPVCITHDTADMYIHATATQYIL